MGRLRDRSGPLDLVEEIFVLPSQRGRQVARLLLRASIRAPRAGLVVRAHAAQQAAARALYTRLGFVASGVPPRLVDSRGRSARLCPRASGSQREEFRVATVGTGWSAAGPRGHVRITSMATQRFLAAHAPLVAEAQRCHDAVGGDGGDVSRTLSVADEVWVAVLERARARPVHE